MGPARVALWSGLVAALHHDGRGGMARMAQTRFTGRCVGSEALRYPINRQRALDLAILRLAPGRTLVCRDCRFMVTCCQHNRRVLASASARRTHAGALSGLGKLRLGVNPFPMAAQSHSPWLGVPGRWPNLSSGSQARDYARRLPLMSKVRMQVSSAFSTVMRTGPIALLAAPIPVPIY